MSDHMHVMNVIKDSTSRQTYKDISTFTQMNDHMRAMFVIKDSTKWQA